MAMKILTGVLAFVVTLPMLLSAQQMTGVWEGQTPGGQPIRLEVVAKDAALTGTMTVAGQKAQIADGKVSNTTFTFSATLEGGTEAFTGEVIDGQRIRMWMDDRGPAAAITLQRSERARKQAGYFERDSSSSMTATNVSYGWAPESNRPFT
jgi:hypothetical protein